MNEYMLVDDDKQLIWKILEFSQLYSYLFNGTKRQSNSSANQFLLSISINEYKTFGSKLTWFISVIIIMIFIIFSIFSFGKKKLNKHFKSLETQDYKNNVFIALETTQN